MSSTRFVHAFDAVCPRVGLGIVPDSMARRVARGLGIAVVPLIEPGATRDLTLSEADGRDMLCAT